MRRLGAGCPFGKWDVHDYSSSTNAASERRVVKAKAISQLVQPLWTQSPVLNSCLLDVNTRGQGIHTLRHTLTHTQFYPKGKDHTFSTELHCLKDTVHYDTSLKEDMLLIIKYTLISEILKCQPVKYSVSFRSFSRTGLGLDLAGILLTVVSGIHGGISHHCGQGKAHPQIT